MCVWDYSKLRIVGRERCDSLVVRTRSATLEKEKPEENTDSELCSCFNTNQSDDGVRTRLLGSLDLWALFNFAEGGNSGEINLLKDELHK